jgi:hypothetical protein
MRSTQRHAYPRQLRRWPIGWRLAACFAAVLAGLAVLALTLLPSSAAHPAPREQAPRVADPALSAQSPAPPPVRVCGNKAILEGGPASPPRGSIVIPAGDDSATVLAHNWTIQPHMMYWFARGRHTLGAGQFGQIIPADGDIFVGAPGAILDGRHANLYAFTQRASNVTIRYLTIRNFGAPGGNSGQGVVNSGMGSGWRIDHVTVRDNAGAGVMLGSNNVLAYSCLKNNGEYGFQAGGSHITVKHNEIVGNNTDDWEIRQPGCGCSGGAKFWGVNQAEITRNYVHDNLGPGLWADTDNRGFNVARNYFADNESEGFIYESSYNLRLADNTFVRNALIAGPRLTGFPDSAVFISESGSDSRVPGPFRKTLAITGNTFIDNWGGVVLWEDADRFCGSPANTSADECTLVDPKVVTKRSCNDANIAKEPYYNGCRWKTQNVLVSRNYFNFDPSKISPKCTPEKYCGFNGIFSEWGSQPSWSPYQDRVVEDHITFAQNNRFKANRYSGPWQFMVREQGNAVSWATWRGTPYHQDAGSTLNRA